MTQVAGIAQQQTTPKPTPLLVRCLRCEYDLRGQPFDSHCPECGLPVAPSHQRAETEAVNQRPPLRLSSTIWLRNLAIACCVMLMVALLTALDALRIVRDLDREEGLQIAQIAIGIGHLALLSVACWLFGTREPLESRSSAWGRHVIRIGGVMVVALPFALMPLMNRYGAMPFFFSRVSAGFSILGGVITWLVARRLAAGARRDGRMILARFASSFAWLAPPLWIVHAMINPSMPYEPRAEWLLNAHPIIGYMESVVAMPFALLTPGNQWTGSSLHPGRWPWVIEAMISLASLILLVLMARLFFIAAATSPRAAPNAG
jgi:hypothetical protein